MKSRKAHPDAPPAFIGQCAICVVNIRKPHRALHKHLIFLLEHRLLNIA